MCRSLWLTEDNPMRLRLIAERVVIELFEGAMRDFRRACEKKAFAGLEASLRASGSGEADG